MASAASPPLDVMGKLSRIGSLPTADVRQLLHMVSSYVKLEMGSEEDQERFKTIHNASAIIKERCAREDSLSEQLEAAKKKEAAAAALQERCKRLGDDLRAKQALVDGVLARRWSMRIAVFIALLVCAFSLQLAYYERNEAAFYKTFYNTVMTEDRDPNASSTTPPPPPPPPVIAPPIPTYPLMSELPLMEHCVPMTFPIPEVLAHQISYSEMSYALHYHQDHTSSPVCAIHIGLPYCFCVMRDNVTAPHVEMFNPRLVGYSVGNEGMAMVQESGLACPRLAWLMRFRVVWIRYQDSAGITVERRFDRPLAYEIQHLLELLAGDTSCGAERLSTLSRLVRDGRDNTNIRWLAEPPTDMYNGGEEVKALGR